ncbi:hypothetical protein HDU92_005676, partial [Lobulomyces angularis]
MKNDHQYKTVDFKEWLSILTKSQVFVILTKAFSLKLVVQDFENFTSEIIKIFEECKKETNLGGANASYIPQLSKVDPNLFGLSICTLDGQRFLLGDFEKSFSIQSCIKPLIYCMALEENGEQFIKNHIGREPSGVAFNSLTLNRENLPHNPMINSGAIMSCSLIKRNLCTSERFEHINQILRKLSGDKQWGFNNAIFLSEKETADNNFCLGYMMRKNHCFPEKTNLMDVLDLYFMCCSIETDCNKLAIVGATLANGGVCPLTGEQIFSRETTRDCISLMYSCGMYDYSGEWAFTIGIPAKSSVSGGIYTVIPNFGSISLFSPAINDTGNSVKGVQFFKKFIQKFTLHNFDKCDGLLTLGDQRINPFKNQVVSEREMKVAAFYAASEGDLFELKRLLTLLPINPAKVVDYDKRTLLHVAATEGHILVCKYLLKHHNCDMHVLDKWGGSPESNAKRFEHNEIVELFKNWKNNNFQAVESEFSSSPTINKTFSFSEKMKKSYSQQELQANNAVNFKLPDIGYKVTDLHIDVDNRTDKVSYRRAIVSGAILISISQLTASFSTQLWQYLIFPVSVPSYCIKEQRAFATGIAASGAGIGEFVMSLVFEKFPEILKLEWTLCILSLSTLTILFQQYLSKTKEKKKKIKTPKLILKDLLFISLFLMPLL